MNSMPIHATSQGFREAERAILLIFTRRMKVWREWTMAEEISMRRKGVKR